MNSDIKRLQLEFGNKAGGATKEHIPIAEGEKIFRQAVSKTAYFVSESFLIDKKVALASRSGQHSLVVFSAVCAIATLLMHKIRLRKHNCACRFLCSRIRLNTIYTVHCGNPITWSKCHREVPVYPTWKMQSSHRIH